MSKIKTYSRYGDPRKHAAVNDREPTTHGLTPKQAEDLIDRFEQFTPQLGGSSAGAVHDVMSDILPAGGNLAPGAGGGYHQAVMNQRRQANLPGGASLGGTSVGNGVMVSQQRPYQPEFASADRQCFVAGTQVVLANGTSKPIEEIMVGDTVLDRSGTPATVEAAWCEGSPDELIEVTLRGGLKFLCTENHRWPVWQWLRECLCGCGGTVRNGKCYINHHHPKKGGPELRIVGGTIRNRKCVPADYDPIHEVEAADIRIDDLLMLPRKFDAVDTDTTPDRARLLGYYVAEGSLYNRGRQTKFALHVDERETLAADIQNICDVDTYTYDEINCQGMTVNTRGGLGSLELAAWFRQHAGERSHTKVLSDEVMAWPIKLKRELVTGMFRGDGCQRWKESTRRQGSSWGFEVQYITTSPKLAQQLFLICAQLGFAFRTYSKEAFVDADGVEHRKSYQLELGGQPARDFADMVWGDWSKTSEHEVKANHAGAMVDDDHVYVRVKSVRRVSNTDALPVHNLSVSGDHSYLVAGVGTFNSYPVHRILANRYWRLFYKLDPVIGNCLDMFAELPWGNFELTGDGVDGEIKDALEYQCEETQLRAMLPYLVKEFLVVGEACPHLFFDDDKGVWTYIAMHNPDQLEVIDAPFIKMDPVVEFIPDGRLQQVLMSNNALLRRVRDSMPNELIVRLMARENIPLSPINFTFIPRKLHPYDTRGTSIIARMWRILMLEDGIFDATIATARRHCFVAGTQVMTADGAVSIEDLKVGDSVIGGTGTPCKVTDAWEEPPGDGLVTIKALGTEPLISTPNHKYKVWAAQRDCACGCGVPVGYNGSGYRAAFVSGHHMRGGRTRDPETGQTRANATLDWKVYSTEPKVRALANHEPVQELEAQHIQRGDYLLMPRTFEAVETSVTPEQARLGGYYLAEGGLCPLNKHKSISLTFAKHEYSTWAEDVLSCGKTLGLNLYRYLRKPTATNYLGKTGREGTTDVRLTRVDDLWFADWCFETFGHGAAEKRLSDQVMGWPLDLKAELIRGYYRGDGSLNPVTSSGDCQQVSAATVSRTLAYQIRLILAQLGVFSSISYNPKAQATWNDMWVVSSTGRDARKLAELVWGVTIESARERAQGAYKGGGARTWVDEQYIYVPVQKIERTSDAVPTYNITVEDDHSYLVAGGIFSKNSSPLKVAKLGSPQTGWIPGPEHERKLLELLAQAELDPLSWLVYHYGISFETIGTTDRIMSIDKHWDLCERIKLIALGISKSFLTGEVTYASAATGLTVFLQRLKALRQMFESKWLYPKFFRTVAKINKWVKPTEAELSSRVRIRRAAHEIDEDARWIVPRIEWDRTLDPSVDSELIGAMQSLQGMGVQFSKSTMMAMVHRDFEEESKQRLKDHETEQEIFKNNPELLAPADAAGGGGALMPGVPPEAFGEELGGEPPAEGGEPQAPMPEGAAVDAAGDAGDHKPADNGPWSPNELKDLADLFDGYEPEDEPWRTAWTDTDVRYAVGGGDPDEIWEALQEWLVREDFPARVITSLEDILIQGGTLRPRNVMAQTETSSYERKLVDMIGEPGGTSFLTGPR